MKVVGLCGQSGAGKGLVCSFFEQLNVKCIDTDRVYHDIISEDTECTKELIAAFGSEIYANPGINRTALRKVVFSSSDNLKILNEITHKHILHTVRQQISSIKNANTADGIIVDAPLLFESGFHTECDATVAVIASNDIKIKRIMSRDNITKDDAEKRISSQISDSDLINKCTFVITNDSTEKDLYDTVRKLKQKLFE